MTCNSSDGSSEIIVAREIYSIGNEFATDYYEAFTATPGCPLSERFYDDRSKYVFLQFGRGPDFMARGADQIGSFNVRMGYHECTLTVMSVDTIEVKPNWLAVLAVGELMRPGEEQPSRKFVQSTVVRYAPSPLAKRFVVVGTVFMFDDKIVDNNVFAPESEFLSALVEHPTNNDNTDNSGNIDTPDRLEDIEKCVKEKQQTAPTKKKAAKKGSIEVQKDNGKKKDDIVKIRDKSITVKETSNKSSENNMDNDNKQVSTTVIIPGQLNINKKLPSIKQLAQLKNPRPKESMKILIDENKTDSDGAVTTVEVSKTKRKSSKKKKSTVAEERPTCSILNDPKEHDRPIKDASKDSTRKKKGPVNDNSPIVPVVVLYVGKLSKLIETNQLTETFCKFGKLISTNIFEVPGKKGQLERRRYGIIQYENSDTVAVVARLGTVVLGNGDTVIVEKSIKKP